MAFMNRVASGQRGTPPSKAIRGLPAISYYPPVIATLAATAFVFVIMLFLTLIAFGNTAAQFGNTGTGDDSGSTGTAAFCGILGIVGLAICIYFVLALVKGVRDLVTPVQYTRGPLADKRMIGGRLVGTWIGVVATYAGPDQAAASMVSDEQAAASTDRSHIVQTRNAPAMRPPERRRTGYLSPERISSTLVTDKLPADPAAKSNRVIFRADTASYEALSPGEEVLVAHSRFLEHIYYIAHLRDGEWEAFRNKALI